MSERVPPALAAAVKSDLQPVQPLPIASRRAAWVAPLTVLTLVASPWMFSVRGDADVLGWPLTWGASIAQAIVAVALIALALRDAVPGRSPRVSVVLLAAAAVLGFSAVITMRAWSISPTTIVPDFVRFVGSVCFTGTIVTAVPLLVITAALASRAFVVRPWSTGILYGLGAGIGADAGWRLFCHYSDPSHVLLTHTGGVIATMVVGMAMSMWRSRSLWRSPLGLR